MGESRNRLRSESARSSYRSLAIAPDNLLDYAVRSTYLVNAGRPDEAVRAADDGLAISPRYAGLFALRGRAELGLHQYEQAKSDVQEAFRLSPRDPHKGWWQTLLCAAEFGLRNLDAAIREFKNSIELGYRLHYPYRNLAACYAIQGKTDEAKAALSEARRVNPKR
jgi:tetratricopeptide (TPR) repeat protein